MPREGRIHVYRKILSVLVPLVLSLLLCAGIASAETATDVVKQCKFQTEVHQRAARRMATSRLDECWDGGSDGTLTVTLPKGKHAQGIMITFSCTPPPLQIRDADGSLLAEWNESFYVAWIPFAHETSKFTLARPAGGDLVISRLNVLTGGDLPDWVERWEHLEPGTADLLLIATHPDDDLLWFGGLLPVYAGERGMRVQVAYMVGDHSRIRRVELLDALWHCGCRYYPEIGDFLDKGTYSKAAAYRAWGGEDAVDAHITGLLRKWQPRVVVTQDLDGEYGHIHHRIMATSVAKCVTALCQDPSYDPESAEKWGVAHPQKLYVHLYPENPLVINWDEPLKAFDGKTGLEVAKEAFRLHVSQQKGKYHVSTKGRTRCTQFGLYYTAVGPDEAGNDLFEHVE